MKEQFGTSEGIIHVADTWLNIPHVPVEHIISIGARNTVKHSNLWVILVNPSKLLHTISGQVPSLTESTSTERSPALGIPGLPLREREPSMKNSMLSLACNT